MLWILEDSGQRISEYRNCLLKRNTVLYLICLGFLGIPFKLKRHPLEILSRCSSALSHGPRENIDVHSQIQSLTELKMQVSSPVLNGATPETVAEIQELAARLQDARYGCVLALEQLQQPEPGYNLARVVHCRD